MQITRRGLMRGLLGGGCSLAAHPWITPMALASVPGDNRLVVILLRGAMDGLDVVRPVEDPLWAGYRPGLAAGPRGLGLASGFELHPGLGGLAPLWTEGSLSFAQAVSTPYRDKRSHFDGQDILEAGTLARQGTATDGWLNRLVAELPGARAETAYAVGSDTQLILSGPAPHDSWTPGTRLSLTPQARDLLRAIYRDDPGFAVPAEMAFRLSEDLLAEADGAPGVPPRAPDALAAFAADRLNHDSRIAAFSITGWDTHKSQQSDIGPPLAQLQAAILRLRADLGANWRQTAVLAMTEFGRTVRENGSGGTDHGTGGAMLLAGGALRGGEVFGRWPGLGEGALYADRDLRPTEDVRAYAGSAIRGLFGVGREVLESRVFPGLDMGSVPEIIA
jgi:uncharacterized protein (DUF1501 family)